MKPLLPRMTLEEAAAAVTERTGEQWTARDIIGAGARGEITVHAKLPHSMKMIRCEPAESGQNEWCAPAGILFPLDPNTSTRLLVGPTVEVTELHFDGPVWRIVAGEAVPTVSPADCWIVDTILARLIAARSGDSPPPTSRVPEKTPDDWKVTARAIADEIHKKDTLAGAHSSIMDIANRVATVMRSKEIHGTRGVPLAGSTIDREALGGGKWTRKP